MAEMRERMKSSAKNSAYPTVSVVMPAYNAEKYIEAAIRSVMEQTYQNWELFVIDDYSTDSTLAVIERLAREDDRITVLQNAENQGVASTRNHGLDLCRGNYVALLDSDDIWYPNKLERQVQLAQETGVDIVYCSYAIIDENDRKICADFIVPEHTDFESSLTKGVISCSTALLSRNIVDTYRFRTEFYHEDLAFWFQILRNGHTVCGVQDVLAKYRVISGSRASNKINSARHRWKIYRKLLGFSVLRSVKLFVRYALLGLKKYKVHSESIEG